MCFAAAAMALALAGCASTQPELVARHPWIEDPSTALVGEDLIIRIRGPRVEVAAMFSFAFRQAPSDRVLTFPIPPTCTPTGDFVATLEGASRTPTRLRTTPSHDPSTVPMGPIGQRFDIHLPSAHFQRHDGKLVVRYSQICDQAFEYTLLSGAYWHGPIGRLEVLVADPDHRVVSGSVEKQPAHRVRADGYRWTFRDIEPRGGVVLKLRSGG
jgi:hypothetical protein